jgi:hypothetical protein
MSRFHYYISLYRITSSEVFGSTVFTFYYNYKFLDESRGLSGSGFMEVDVAVLRNDPNDDESKSC